MIPLCKGSQYTNSSKISVTHPFGIQLHIPWEFNYTPLGITESFVSLKLYSDQWSFLEKAIGSKCGYGCTILVHQAAWLTINSGVHRSEGLLHLEFT